LKVNNAIDEEGETITRDKRGNRETTSDKSEKSHYEA
jgi:hypothetical protein